eukprot:TRINITY_DN209_c0_g1_i13.p1 TRINITY_DN209_c0_g1~~TRINITY_DN209_c0_g1_i13.p1  ORF type:complete len:736 (-),score=97.26 TRINITY_DN209_c0_g1_i13:799-3006(-)
MGNQRSVVCDSGRDGFISDIITDAPDGSIAKLTTSHCNDVYKLLVQRVPEVSGCRSKLELVRCIRCPLLVSRSSKILCAFWSRGGVLRCIFCTKAVVEIFSYVVSPLRDSVSGLDSGQVVLPVSNALSACLYGPNSVFLLARERAVVCAFNGSIIQEVAMDQLALCYFNELVKCVHLCDGVIVIWCQEGLNVLDHHGVIERLSEYGTVPKLESDEDSIMLWRYDAVIRMVNTSTMIPVVIDIKCCSCCLPVGNVLPTVMKCCTMCGDILVDASESVDSVRFHDLSSWHLPMPSVSVQCPPEVIAVGIAAHMTGMGPQLAVLSKNSVHGPFALYVMLHERNSLSFDVTVAREYIDKRPLEATSYYESMMQMQSQCKRIDGILEAQFDMEKSYHGLITFQCEADESEARQSEVFDRYMEWLRQSVVSVYNMTKGLHLDVLSAIETVASKVVVSRITTVESLAQDWRECFQQVLESVVGLIALYRDCDEGLVHKWIFELRANYIRNRILLNDAETHSAPAVHLQKLRDSVAVCKHIMMKAYVDIMGTCTSGLTIRGLPVLRDVTCDHYGKSVRFALETPHSLHDLDAGSLLPAHRMFFVRQIARLLLCFHRENMSYPLSPASVKFDGHDDVCLMPDPSSTSSVFSARHKHFDECSSDVWSLGLVTYPLFASFGGAVRLVDIELQRERFPDNAIDSLREADVPIPEIVIDLLRGCLQPDSHNRITSWQAFNMLKHVTRE